MPPITETPAEKEGRLKARREARYKELRNTSTPIDLLARYPVENCLARLDIRRKRFYEHVKAGRIRLIKDGRRSFVSGAELARLSQVPGTAVAV